MIADQTRELFRVNATDFTRTRLLTLPTVALTILRGHKVSQQNALNKVFRELEQLPAVPTASAYCQARQKVRPELFAHLNAIVCAEFYQRDETTEQVKRWRGRRLLGADGTKLNLPDAPTLRQAFSLHPNQHGEVVQALAVVLHDLLNDLALAASLGPVRGEKWPLLEQLWVATQVGDILVLDRNFGDYALLAWAVLTQRDVIIRCRRDSFKAVEEFWQSDETEALVTLPVSQHTPTRRFVREHDLPTSVTVRLLKFTLPSGETEVLLTTLLDQKNYPSAEFYTVYGWRWNDETFYDRLKNIFEVERLSGLNERAIQQDFHGVIFLASLESVLTKSAQSALTRHDMQRATQLPGKVNRAVSYVALVDTAIRLLLDQRKHVLDVLTELQQLFQQTPTRHHPNRHYPRPKPKAARRLRYQQYTKRILQ